MINCVHVCQLNSPDEEDAIEMEPLNQNVDGWEIARNRIALLQPIGHGAFGAVWRALLHRSDNRCGNRSVAAKCFTRKFIESTKHFIRPISPFLFVYRRIVS